MKDRLLRCFDATAAQRWGWGETLVWLLWCGVVSYAAWQHSPWADEMQAWLLAGGVGWKTLFATSLHYEGTGGLWHVLLKLLQLIRVPFAGMRWFAVAMEAGGVAVLLGYAPFPALVRWLLPFTFFLLYQDGVVARSYCLFAVLAFSAAALLRGSRPRPLVLALLLGLMANISLHGAVASGGLVLSALLVWRGRFWRSLPAMLVLAGLWAGAISAMTPARDVDFEAGNNIQRSVVKLKQQLGLRTGPPPPVISGLPMAGLAPAPVPVHIRHGAARLWNKLSRVLGVITYPLSSSRVLALALVGCVCFQALLMRKRRLGGSAGAAALLPYGLMVAVFATMYLAPRHAGMVMTGFVVSAWLGWPGPGQNGHKLALERVTAALFACVCLQQIAWTAEAIDREHRFPYGPGRMTADYLKSQGAVRKTLAGYYYYSIDPLLYFDRNLYVNQPAHRYWSWSTRMRTGSTVWDVLRLHPEFIVVGGFERGPDAEITRDWHPNTPPDPAVVMGDSFGFVRFFEAQGYRQTRVFCGHSWMRASYAEELCDTVLQPVAR